ncbi:FAD-binding protein [Lysobacter changpingensis]|uniref:FAD-binding protein n=1 Tax=Lysobacter changpingensis TaxID=2792784 RepID=UPI001A8CC5FF|nr:FAD-binding protein [Lysobacter changpingensis]
MRRPATPPVVVVGAGVAGLSVALSAAPREVILLDPGGIGSSRLAQGGIAAALAAGDSVRAHVADTLQAGAFHNDAAIAWSVIGAAPDAVAWLQVMGVGFDRDGQGLQLGREGGHGVHRIVHAGGDRTGECVVAALQARLARAAHVHRRTGASVQSLLMRGRNVAGVEVRGDDGRIEVIEAGAVVLATGGLGALFERSTNAETTSGSGLALAMAAGAHTRDLEFVQFHPTALDADGPRLPLITEALRGAGARLRDHRGRRLMRGRHPLGDLAPRDVVSRRVWEAGRDGPVWIDATGLTPGWERAFPTVAGTCRAHGVDPRTQPIPVTAAAHFHMGGIATDALGRTSVPNLFAVGEVACNGLHGANRLASNSLLEGVVCGRWLGAHLRLAPARVSHEDAFRTVALGEGLGASALATVRRTLWHAAGPVRTKLALASAIREIRAMAASGWQARVAQAVLEAALQRPASLGAHWRVDA